MNRIETRFTQRFGIDHPIMLAPMDKVAGGALAAAVSAAGGLGMIGGGYGDTAWLDNAFSEAGNQPVGVGFITWSVQPGGDCLQRALDRAPPLLMVSFGDAAGIVARAHAADIAVGWQIQRIEQARQAIEAGTEVLVVQGQEAGGHGMDRGLISLLPAVRDIAPADQIILAAGGIADGRGLAAALMLGADGIMMGTRFWASVEASGSEHAKALITRTGGDQTVRTKVFDIARGVNWPDSFTGRVARNDFADKWHDKIDQLQQHAAAERSFYEASDIDDYRTRVLIAGEASDLIDSVQPAAQIIESTVAQACQLLSAGPAIVTESGSLQR